VALPSGGESVKIGYEDRLWMVLPSVGGGVTFNKNMGPMYYSVHETQRHQKKFRIKYGIIKN